MKNYQQYERIIAEIKKCNDRDVSKYFSEATEIFPILSKSQQQESVEEFFAWAEKHSTHQPLKFTWAKFMVGWNHFLSDRHEAALETMIETKKLFEEQNDVGGAACSTAVMGGVHRTLGNTDLMLKLGYECQRQLVPLGMFRHFLSACTCTMGIIYYEMNNDSEAIHYLESTLENAEESGDFFWSNYSLHGLGKVYLRKEQYDKAKGYFERALREAEKANSPLGICNSLTELANYHFQTGNFPEAERLHTQALELRLQNNFIGGAVTSYMRLGEILIKDSKHEEALSVITKGLALAEQIKVNPKISQAHFLLSEIYGCKNDPAKALDHYRKYHDISAQVEQEENARRVKNVKIAFEAEQAQKDNVIIRQQKAEIEKKNAQLQETIDALTMARISRKARALVLGIALVLFVFEDTILHFALNVLNSDNYFASMAVKIGIIFSLKPILTGIEHYLMKEVVRKRKIKKSPLAEVLPA